ncbi:hypothetical protein JCM16161A_02220 [Vulcanisaeta sp. JCM 16161]|uniref:hypothetical protein n=1 Tax=Vulcanisaeta sp. JCM 16161 TaxID=1295372 RepID=UPI0006D02F47|nr:hypothetical protein [Vulcanisaeta sp. JCM 16161]
MGTNQRPGFGELLRAKPQPQAPTPIPSQEEAISDNTVARYRLYAQLLAIGEAKDREYVKSAVAIDELVHVVRAVLGNDPRAIALEYITKYASNQQAVLALLRDLRDSCPEWLRPLIDIATGGR